jgi:hypothetical protein
MVTGTGLTVAIRVKVGLNQARGTRRCDPRRYHFRHRCPSTSCSTAGVVPPKSSLVEWLDESNLESVKSLILSTRSLLSGQKLPCSPFEGISQQITAAQGFVGFARLLKRVNAKAIPVNFPDSRGEQPNLSGRIEFIGCGSPETGWPRSSAITFPAGLTATNDGSVGAGHQYAESGVHAGIYIPQGRIITFAVELTEQAAAAGDRNQPQ